MSIRTTEELLQDIIDTIDITKRRRTTGPNMRTLLSDMVQSLGGGRTGKTIWVDKTNGDNSTGVAGMIQYPFKTITAAQSAASSGDTIVVLPETYSNDTALGKDGVSYYFFPNTSVINSENIWTANGISFKVMGYGYFSTTGGDGYQVMNLSNSANVEMQAYAINGENIGGGDIAVNSSSILHLSVIKSVVGYGYAFVSNTGGQIYASGHTLQGGISLVASTSSTSKIFTNFQENIMNTPAGIPFSYGISYGGGLIEVRGKIVVEDGAVNTTLILHNAAASGGSNETGIRIYDDIDIQQDGAKLMTGFAGSSTAPCHVYGNVVNSSGTTATPIVVGNSNSDIILHGNLYLYSGSNPAISISNGKLTVKGKVVALSNDAAAHGITKSGGTLILDRCVIVNTHASSNSVYAATSQNVIAYNPFYKNAVHGNITEQVGMGTQDSNVQ